MFGTRTKFLTLFIAAFLCINLSGSACLAYCGLAQVQMPADHCPLANMDRKNCPPSEKDDEKQLSEKAFGAAENKIDCCALPLTPVFANLSQKQNFQSVVALLPDKTAPPKVKEFEEKRNFTAVHYQKPFYDHRGERIKHCVFLI